MKRALPARPGRAAASAVGPELTILLAAFLASRLLFAALGIRFEGGNLAWYWQFLDVDLLQNDLLRSLWYLHAQPPLLNLAVGTSLKLFPGSWELVLGACYAFLGLIMTVAMYGVLVRLRTSPVGAAAWTGLFVVGPACVLYENYLFYTYPVAVALCVAALVLARFLDTGRQLYAHVFFGLLGTVALTRSLFHLVWLLAIPLTLAPLLWRRRGLLRKLGVALLAPLLVVTLWYAKNLVLFGTFSASSWLGLNLFPVATAFVDEEALEALHRDGRISELYRTTVVASEAFGGPVTFARLDAYPARFRHGPPHGIPALDSPTKSGTHPVLERATPNFNHRAYVGISRRLLRDALVVITTHPGAYVRAVASNVATLLRPSESYLGPRWSSNAATLASYARCYGLVVKGSVPPSPTVGELGLADRFRGKALWLALLIPAALAYGVRDALRRRDDPAHVGIVAFLTLNVVYVAVVAVSLNLGEANRMFFLVEPSVWVLIAVAAQAAWRSAGVRKPGREGI